VFSKSKKRRVEDAPPYPVPFVRAPVVGRGLWTRRLNEIFGNTTKASAAPGSGGEFTIPALRAVKRLAYHAVPPAPDERPPRARRPV